VGGEPEPDAARERAVLGVALVVATCGLVYELLASTVASWVLGDTVGQFSVVIGLYLGAMGLGSWLSGRVARELSTWFVATELAIALVGGITVPTLFRVFEQPAVFRAVLYASVLLIGALVGMEIPLLLRVLGARASFRGAVAKVLAFDHLGSLLGSVAFAFVLAPRLGALRSGVLVAGLNAVAAIVSTWVMPEPVRAPGTFRVAGVALLAGLALVYASAAGLERAVDRAEAPARTPPAAPAGGAR
jgi:spermidine synthase